MTINNSDMTGNLAHFDSTKSCADAVYRMAERHPKCNKLLLIANSCRDLLRGNKVYIARDTTAQLLNRAIEIERELTSKRKSRGSDRQR